MSTKLKKMEKQRLRLNADIRAEKRAEKERRRTELLAARQQLGVWLAEAVNADTPEDVARLRDTLDRDQVREVLAKHLMVGSTITDAQDDELLAARQQLGVWLAEAVNADTPEDVARLRDTLDRDQVREVLAKHLMVGSTITDAQDDDAEASDHSDTGSSQREVYEGHNA